MSRRRRLQAASAQLPHSIPAMQIHTGNGIGDSGAYTEAWLNVCHSHQSVTWALPALQGALSLRAALAFPSKVRITHCLFASCFPGAGGSLRAQSGFSAPGPVQKLSTGAQARGGWWLGRQGRQAGGGGILCLNLCTPGTREGELLMISS